MACALGAEDIAHYLVDEGVEVNLRHGRSATDEASGNMAPSSMIVNSTVIPRISPLQLAVYSSNIELISAIAAKGEINYQDQVRLVCMLTTATSLISSHHLPPPPMQSGFTALHYATLRRNKDVVLLLLDLGASAIIESKVRSFTPLP